MLYRNQSVILKINVTQASTKQGNPDLFVAIDRMPKFALVQLHQDATRPHALRVYLPILDEKARTIQA